MTARGAALLLAPPAALALGARVAPLRWVAVALLVAALVAVLVDGRRAPGAARLRARREHDDPLSVGRPNPVGVRIELDGGGRYRATVRDEHPADMRASVEVTRLWIPGEVAYALTPPVRGSREFGRTVVRAEGPWRLGWRQSSLGAPATVRVDPDLSAVRSFEALARRGQLAEMGVRSLRRPGEGTEFERVRDAVPDDPLRTINWRATARSGRLMATELIPERAQPVIICLDHGRLMGVGAGELTKLDHAINAALLLVHVALRSGDRAGLLAFDDRVTVALSPRAGRGQMRAVLDALQPLRAGLIEADYDEALAYLSRWQRRRALLAIFTDVLDTDQGAALLRQCARLRRRHLPLVITVRDPALDDAARLWPREPAEAYARAVAGGLLADREASLRVLRRSGVDTLDADARTLSPRLVNRYLELKRRARL
ncbi:MAG: DUF58 domain-containing protein [Chloroflexi bacterium]|nr:MAG: DUF58 domain-containing protein [Chloroflexota bacterium]